MQSENQNSLSSGLCCIPFPVLFSLVYYYIEVFKIYYMWLFVSFLVSLWMVSFYPNYNDNEFVLFTDITTILFFLPGFFLMFYSILVQLLLLLVKKAGAIAPLAIILYILNTVVVSFITSYSSIFLNIAISIVCSSLSIIHFFISLYLKKRLAPI